mmetsp:Transcript_37681/g.72524  ORF Transcript_37681/g.72524 Transcript_37681/m.72524 type:complete len:229 (+) Transcript_37681:1050-1736(+)
MKLSSLEILACFIMSCLLCSHSLLYSFFCSNSSRRNSFTSGFATDSPLFLNFSVCFFTSMRLFWVVSMNPMRGISGWNGRSSPPSTFSDAIDRPVWTDTLAFFFGATFFFACFGRRCCSSSASRTCRPSWLALRLRSSNVLPISLSMSSRFLIITSWLMRIFLFCSSSFFCRSASSCSSSSRCFSISRICFVRRPSLSSLCTRRSWILCCSSRSWMRFHLRTSGWISA